MNRTIDAPRCKRSGWWKCLASVLIFISIVGAGLRSAYAADEQPSVTRHQIEVDGGMLNYTAKAGRIAIRDVLTGEPRARMFYTAYALDDREPSRPVTFVWGGGPGGSSLSMDLIVAGPVRLSERELVPNGLTWLTHTDLVFVDQVGVGYSRPTRREYVAEFNGTIGDTYSFAEFIRAWRIQNDFEAAPIFLAGVSWGAPRAATVAHVLAKQGLPVHGTVMIAGEASLNHPYIPRDFFEALRVVGMAEVARFHGRLPPELGDDRETVEAVVDKWVRDTYFPTLQRRSSLTEGERESLAQELSRFTGVPSSLIDRDTLVVTPKQFRGSLLQGQGKSLYGFDVRLTEAPKSWFEDLDVILEHIHDNLGYRTDLPYREIRSNKYIGYAPYGEYPALPGHDWNFATSQVPLEEADEILLKAVERGGGPPTIGTPLPATAETVASRPGFRSLIITGRYDGESTCPANAELARSLPPELQQALTFECYDSGHSPWETPGVDEQLKQDVREFIGAFP